MPIAYCPHCSRQSVVPAESLGRAAVCSHCRQTFPVAVFVPPPRVEAQPIAQPATDLGFVLDPEPPRPRRRPAPDPLRSPWLVALAVMVGLAVLAACGVYLFERASLRWDRERLDSLRFDLARAIDDQIQREGEIDRQRPFDPRELGFERERRYETDARWRAARTRVVEAEYEIRRILKRWPELR